MAISMVMALAAKFIKHSLKTIELDERLKNLEERMNELQKLNEKLTSENGDLIVKLEMMKKPLDHNDDLKWAVHEMLMDD